MGCPKQQHRKSWTSYKDMRAFQALTYPKQCRLDGQRYTFWYVEAQDDEYSVLLDACFVCEIKDIANPLVEMYYDSESDAYACMEEYYDRHDVPFPYYNQMQVAMVQDDIIDVPVICQEVMDFV